MFITENRYVVKFYYDFKHDVFCAFEIQLILKCLVIINITSIMCLIMLMDKYRKYFH